MRLGQVIARAPEGCPQITVYATVYYGTMGTKDTFFLNGYAYGEDGAYTERKMLAEREEQEEFTAQEFTKALETAGFYMPARPTRVAGSLRQIYKLRPVPVPQEEMGYSFTLNARNQDAVDHRKQEQAHLEQFRQDLNR